MAYRVPEEAWELKDQMLERDCSDGKHTSVLNDEGDYYQSRAWSTASEKADAEDKEAERYDKMHQRQKMQLNLAL